MERTLYILTKFLFTGGVSAVVSTILIGRNNGLLDSSGSLLSRPDYGTSFSFIDVALAFLPLVLSVFVFESAFTHPIIQGLCCSFISAWIIVHIRISQWNYTGTLGLLIDKAGLILSLIFLMRPDILIHVLSIPP